MLFKNGVIEETGLAAGGAQPPGQRRGLAGQQDRAARRAAERRRRGARGSFTRPSTACRRRHLPRRLRAAGHGLVPLRAGRGAAGGAGMPAPAHARGRVSVACCPRAINAVVPWTRRGDRDWGLRRHARTARQRDQGGIRRAACHRRLCRVRVAPACAGPSRGRSEVAHEDRPSVWQPGGSAPTVDRERGPEHAGATRALPPPPRHAQPDYRWGFKARP
jgi:hypothetical protein